MEASIKLCITCRKPIKGRTDKKYCNDYCRNSYNNQVHSNCNNYIRHINSLLQKNRRILSALLSETSTQTKIAHAQLVERGFLFQYSTHHVSNKKGNLYHFCYEFGYLALNETSYLVVRRKNRESSH
ncbi:MAG: hypothetical protein WCH78_12280 [Bacteroidota bacterium]